MKPAPFAYADPRTVEEALALLGRHGADAAVLAGGQSLLPQLNLRLVRPAVVVDVNRLAALEGVTVGGDGVRCGALARAAALERDERVTAALPVIRSALRCLGYPQIRNRTTVGGSLAHADPTAELPTLVAALDGRITLASARGERTLGWEEFLLGPNRTARTPDELVVSVELPIPAGLRMTFAELPQRQTIVGACVGLRRDQDVVAEARIALCGVASHPIRLRSVEAELVGRPLDDDRRELAAAVRACLDPPSDDLAPADYRRDVAGTLVARAMAQAWAEEARA